MRERWKTGERVTSLKSGDRVGVTWFHDFCGQCEYCQQGKEFLQLAAEIRVETDIEVYLLDEVNEVLRRIKQSDINGSAVLKI